MKGIDLNQKALDAAINTLKSLGCDYKVTYGEQVYSNQIQKTKKPRKPRTYTHGELLLHYWPQIGDMQIGELKKISCEPYTAREIQASVTGKLSRVWGNKTYSTQLNLEENTVTVYRHSENQEASE